MLFIFFGYGQGTDQNITVKGVYKQKKITLAKNLKSCQ